MAYKLHKKDKSGKLIEIPLFAEKTEKDSDGNIIKTTYLKIENVDALFNNKADRNNENQSIISNIMKAKVGSFENISSQILEINNSIASINQTVNNALKSISTINSTLAKKMELYSHGSVTLIGNITINGWYTMKQMKIGSNTVYDLEIIFPTFNMSSLINQNSDTTLTIKGLPAFTSIVSTPMVFVVQTSPGPTNDYMNSQSGQYENANPSAGTINIRLRRAYSEAYTYCNILVKGIIK